MKIEEEDNRAAGFDDLLRPFDDVRYLYKFDRLALTQVFDPTRVVWIGHFLIEFFDRGAVLRTQPQRIVLGHQFRQLLPENFFGHAISSIREYRMVQPLHRKLVGRQLGIPFEATPA